MFRKMHEAFNKFASLKNEAANYSFLILFSFLFRHSVFHQDKRLCTFLKPNGFHEAVKILKL